MKYIIVCDGRTGTIAYPTDTDGLYHAVCRFESSRDAYIALKALNGELPEFLGSGDPVSPTELAAAESGEPSQSVPKNAGLYQPESTESGEWRVYGLLDPRSNAVFYVGMTCRLQDRLSQHRNDPMSAAYPTILDIREAGEAMVIVDYGAFATKEAAREHEDGLIATMDGLVNRDIETTRLRVARRKEGDSSRNAYMREYMREWRRRPKEGDEDG